MSFLIASTYLMSSVVGIGVVEAQVAAAAELPGDAEVEADRLHVADVREAVRLGEARVDRPAEAAARDVVGDHLADEVLAGGGFARHRLAGGRVVGMSHAGKVNRGGTSDQRVGTSPIPGWPDSVSSPESGSATGLESRRPTAIKGR